MDLAVISIDFILDSDCRLKENKQMLKINLYYAGKAMGVIDKHNVTTNAHPDGAQVSYLRINKRLLSS